MSKKLIWGGGYVAAFVLINLIVNWLGPLIVPVTTVAAVCANMLIRDRIFYDAGPRYSIAAATAAGLFTVAISIEAGMVALASMVAVIAGACTSAAAYKLLRGPFEERRPVANTCSAVVDALVFPTVAFIQFMPWISFAQFSMKVITIVILSYVIKRFFEFAGNEP